MTQLNKSLLLITFIIMTSIFFTHSVIADNDNHKPDVKHLKETGKISSLEFILDKLSGYNISRILEVELEQKNNHYTYEIEYIDTRGKVYEIEVDARTAQVLKTEREY